MANGTANKTANEKTDLGTGSIPKLMLKLAIPAVIAQIVNLLYNIVDRIYIGHIPEIGASALTGVGLFTPMLMMMTAFAMMVGSGGAPHAAIAMGQNDRERAEKILGNSMTMLIVFSVLLTLLFYFSSPTLLRLFGASDVTLPYALSYARIYITGSIFVLTVLGMNAFITAQGFAKISMLTTLIGAVINIVLDPILIFGLKMGVQGAATATVFSQAVGAIWVIRFLSGKQTLLRLKISNLKLQGNIILPCMALGFSTFVMLCTESLLSISFTSSLARYGGDIAVGTMTIINSISQLVTMPCSGMTQGVQPILSFNFGAGNKERVKLTFRLLLTTSAVYTFIFYGATQLFPQGFAKIFTTDTELINYAARCIRIYMAGIFALGFQFACQQSFMALGQAKISLLMACLRKLILLIPLIYILPVFFADKVFAVLLAEPFCDVISASVTTGMFLLNINGILERGPANPGGH